VIFSIVGYLRPGVRPPTQSGPQTPLIPSAAPVAGAVDPLTIRAPLDIDLARVPGFAHDPFLFGNESRDVQVVSAGPTTDADPLVRSILVSSTRRLAVVNGRIVSVGDQVGSFKVAEIEQSAVVFALASGERRRVNVHGQAPAGLTR
jgi:hypothetical protein